MLRIEFLNGGIKKGRAVIAIELQFVERSSDAEPARHVRGFDATHARDGDGDDIAAAHRPADQDYFEFDGRIDFETLWAEEKHAGRADVSGYERDRIFFRDACHAAKAKRKPQRGARIFALFMEDADGVGGHAGETANGESARRAERNNLQRGSAKRRGSRGR